MSAGNLFAIFLLYYILDAKIIENIKVNNLVAY